MDLITKKSELIGNIAKLQEYLTATGIDRDFAVNLIRNGICFVVTEHNGKLFFAPSRFVGYRNNSRHDHEHNADKDGRETNAAIEAILKAPPIPSQTLEREYERFCVSIGTQVRKAPFGIVRKFWDLR